MWLKACINGQRLPHEHSALPVTPAQLAADVLSVLAAGADAVHFHPKDQHGVDSLREEHVTAALAAIRLAAPGVALGVTTGAWTAADPAHRIDAVRSWTLLPDFASVNWHEEGADDLAAALLRRDIEVEAGLWHADAVNVWSASPYRDQCVRLLVELGETVDPATTTAQADELLARIAEVGAVTQVLLHGEGTSAWPALRHAAARGLAVRVGLEDVLHLPDGSPAPDNAALVSTARAIVQ